MFESLEINFNFKCDRDLFKLVMQGMRLLELETIVNNNFDNVIPLTDLDGAYSVLNDNIKDYCVEYGLNEDEIRDVVAVFSNMDKLTIESKNKEVG